MIAKKFTAIMVVVALLFVSGITIVNDISEAAEPYDNEFNNGNYKYEITGADTVKIKGFAPYANKEEVIVPDVVVNNDVEYKVTSVGEFSSYSAYLKKVVLGNNIETVEDEAFSSASDLSYLDLGKNVKTIGESAFNGCNSLQELLIPDSVTEIKNSAFYYCQNLKTIIIGNGVINIGDEAFYNCISAKELIIGANVRNIGAWAFYYLQSLEKLYFVGQKPVFGENALSLYLDENRSNGLNFDGNGWSDENLAEVGELIKETSSALVPVEAKNVGVDEGFCGEHLTYRIVSNMYLFIEGYGSMYSYGNYDAPWSPKRDYITSISITENVTSIGDHAFQGILVNSISIPNSVTYIGRGAFEDNTALETVTIPSNIVMIGNGAFRGCCELEKIVFRGNMPVLGEESFRLTVDAATYASAVVYSYDNSAERAFTSEVTGDMYDMITFIFKSTGNNQDSGPNKLFVVILAIVIVLILICVSYVAVNHYVKYKKINNKEKRSK